jgi:transcriptional regulator
MYIPDSFREDRIPVLQEHIARKGFATLVTLGSAGLTASHIPMLLDAAGEPFGTLRGHLSRANGQWRDLSPDVEALAIFSGPQHYVSPSWYPSKAETGKVVPTWNYAVVHAYGYIRIVEDPEWLLRHVSSLTEAHEAAFETPWKVTDAPADFVRTMLNGIVGIEMPIRKLEGKWKVNQNRSASDQRGVADALERLQTPESKAMADLVRDATPKTNR